MNVLLVENEQLMAALRRAGYGASVASPAEARTMATAGLFDAIVLGGAHPDATSLSLCSALRQSAACTPILMLVARDEAETRIRGLEAGADDCVSLSCPADELLARLRALVRRADRS